MTESSQSAAVVTLKPRRALPFFNRHPWVFAGAIRSVAGNPNPGDEVVVRSSDGQFVAFGLFNPHSNIRVRLYSWDEEKTLSDDLFRERIREAIALRQQVVPFDADVRTARRLVFSEADGLSGLTVDAYSSANSISQSWLVVSFTSLALESRSQVILDELEQLTDSRGMWLRTEKGIRKAEGLDQRDGLIGGEPPPSPLQICENGLTFEVDVCEGQKTGWFLDQSQNRARAADYLDGNRVLDLFCYSGGFGVTIAARSPAAQVTGVDSSAVAIAQARRHAELNGVDARMQFEESDVFRFLEAAVQRGDQFDLVLLDPPKMARQQSGLSKALRGYHSLNELAGSLVRPGGILVTCSCSGLISRDDFERMLAGVSTSLDRRIQILESRGAAPDHPVSPNCPENNYLKCCICRIV